MSSTINALFNAKKLKYRFLDILITKDHHLYFYKKTQKNLNLFIDVRSIIGKFFSPMMDLEAILNIRTEKLIFASELLNVAGHYRNYFFKKGYDRINIFLYYSSKPPKRRVALCPEYKKDFLTRHSDQAEYQFQNDILEANLEILQDVCDNVPNVYFIDSGEIAFESVPYIVSLANSFSKKTHTNIILANNHDYLAYLKFPNFYILTLRGEKSLFITRGTWYADFLLETKFLKDNKPVLIDYRLAAAAIAIVGSKKSDLPGWKGYGSVTSIKYLNSLVTSGLIDTKNTELYNPGGVLKILQETENAEENFKIFKRNLQILDPVEDYHEL